MYEFSTEDIKKSRTPKEMLLFLFAVFEENGYPETLVMSWEDSDRTRYARACDPLVALGLLNHAQMSIYEDWQKS